MKVRVVVSTLVLLAIMSVLVFDGVSMYGAHRDAMDFSEQAAKQAAQTYVDTSGNEDAVRTRIETMAAEGGVQVVDLSYHKGTTRWYQVTIEAQGQSILLKYIPYFKDQLSQDSTTIQHF
jgi:hypothetical protein